MKLCKVEGSTCLKNLIKFHPNPIGANTDVKFGCIFFFPSMGGACVNWQILPCKQHIRHLIKMKLCKVEGSTFLKSLAKFHPDSTRANIDVGVRCIFFFPSTHGARANW